MSVTTLFSIPLTASYTLQPQLAPQEASLPAFKSATATPARASRELAPVRAASPSAATISAARLTHANNTRAVLRHAPLRPWRGHIVDAPDYMRAACPGHASHNKASARPSQDDAVSHASQASLGRHASVDGIASSDLTIDASSMGSGSFSRNASSIGGGSLSSDTSSIGGDSLATSGYHSVDNESRRPSLSESSGRAARAGSLGHGQAWQVTEAAITMTDDTPDIAMSQHALLLPGGPRGPSPAVSTAVAALLAECREQPVAHRAPGPRTTAPAADAADIAESAELYRLGGHVHRALFDRAPGWLARATSAVTDAALRLAKGAVQQNIELAFVRLGLRHAIDNPASRNAPPSTDVHGPHTASTTHLSATLDAVGRLRVADDAQRRELDAALDRALPPQIVPQSRLIAKRIVDVVAEMANDVQAAVQLEAQAAAQLKARG